MPVVVEMTSATAVNLALLTADLFSLFCGLFLFHYAVSDVYDQHGVGCFFTFESLVFLNLELVFK